MPEYSRPAAAGRRDRARREPDRRRAADRRRPGAVREIARTAASPAELPPALELHAQIADADGRARLMLTLYDAARCPYCARVRIVLAEKGIEYEPIEIDLSDRPAWIYEKNATGRVPVVEEDAGSLLPESAVIMEYLEERYPEPALLAADPADRALRAALDLPARRLHAALLRAAARRGRRRERASTRSSEARRRARRAAVARRRGVRARGHRVRSVGAPRARHARRSARRLPCALPPGSSGSSQRPVDRAGGRRRCSALTLRASSTRRGSPSISATTISSSATCAARTRTRAGTSPARGRSCSARRRRAPTRPRSRELAKEVALRLRRHGITGDERLVLVDRGDGVGAMPAAQMAELAGHPRVSILLGGLAAWPGELAEGTVELEPVREASTRAEPARIPDAAGARVAARRSRADDPRRAPRGGVHGQARQPVRSAAGAHPGCANASRWDALRGGGRPAPPERVRELVGAPEGAEIVAYCHSGSRSALATLALRAAGYDARNYAGSWHEWSRHPELPLER